jgi:hypothetical protein
VNGAQEQFGMGPVFTILFTLFRSSLDYSIVATTGSGDDDAFTEQLRRFALLNSQRNPSNTLALGELARISDQSLTEFKVLLDGKDHEIDAKNRELAAVYDSSSWRMTRPLRTLTRSIRTQRSSLRHNVGVMAAEGLAKLRKYPRLKSAAIAGSRLFPPLERRLRRLAEPWAPRASPWAIDVNPQVLAEWTTIIRQLP